MPSAKWPVTAEVVEVGSQAGGAAVICAPAAVAAHDEAAAESAVAAVAGGTNATAGSAATAETACAADTAGTAVTAAAAAAAEPAVHTAAVVAGCSGCSAELAAGDSRQNRATYCALVPAVASLPWCFARFRP